MLRASFPTETARIFLNILTASRGDEGIALAAHERPDVIVLDVQMPGGGDGWLTYTHLKNDPSVAHS